MLAPRLLPILPILLYSVAAAAQTAPPQTALPPQTAPQATPLPAPAAEPAPAAGPLSISPAQPSPPSTAAEHSPPPASAAEQLPPAPSAEQPPSRAFCDQNVAFRIDDPVSAPEQYRPFVGVWSDAAWDARTCAALVVQRVAPDGKASIVYIYGPEGARALVPGAVLRGTGVIKDGELRFQNSDGSQYAFRPRVVDAVVIGMVGHWINAKGESFQATFKQTP
jgi:hypothetical protein